MRYISLNLFVFVLLQASNPAVATLIYEETFDVDTVDTADTVATYPDLVFVDPNGWGGMPDALRPVFDKHNLIWIGAKANESSPSEEKGIWTSMLASRALEMEYAIDLNRLYVGSSGATAITAVNVLLMANQYSGAVFFRGSQYWHGGQPEGVDNLRRKHYVFITGSNDKAKGDIRKDYDRYKRDGVKNVKLIYEMKSVGRNPSPAQMDEAIRYLDSHLMQ